MTFQERLSEAMKQLRIASQHDTTDDEVKKIDELIDKIKDLVLCRNIGSRDDKS